MKLAQFKKKYKRFEGLAIWISRRLRTRLAIDVIILNRNFLEQSTEPQIRFALWHEVGHFKNGLIKDWLIGIKQSERQAQHFAILKMQQEGYSFNDLFCFEINYRLFEKYGLTAKEYIKEMRK